MWRSRWRSGPTPCSSGGPWSGGWPPRARPASARSSTDFADDLDHVLALAGARTPADLDLSMVSTTSAAGDGEQLGSDGAQPEARRSRMKADQ